MRTCSDDLETSLARSHVLSEGAVRGGAEEHGVAVDDVVDRHDRPCVVVGHPAQAPGPEQSEALLFRELLD